MITSLKLLLGKFNINYALIGLIIYALVITLLWRLEITSHKLTVSEYEAKSHAQIAKNAIETKEREKITRDVVTSYAESINKLKEYYASNPTVKFRTIRVQDTNASGMPTASKSASRVDQGHNGTQEDVADRASNEVQINTQKTSEEIVQCLELIKFSKNQDAVE